MNMGGRNTETQKHGNTETKKREGESGMNNKVARVRWP